MALKFGMATGIAKSQRRTAITACAVLIQLSCSSSCYLISAHMVALGIYSYVYQESR